MNYVGCLLISVLAVEVLLRIPILPTVSSMHGTALRSLKVVTSKTISDHWKEKAVLAYSKAIAVATVKLALYFSAAIIVLWSAAYLLDKFADRQSSFLTFLVSSAGLIATTGFSLAYVLLRPRLVK